MAITQNTYTGDGSTVLFSFTFEYIAESDIKITLDGTLTTEYTLANATTIQFNTAPANGVDIRIYRDTNIDTLSAQFFPGSAIRAEDLNTNFTQNLYVTQEVSNNAVQSDDSIPFVNDISMGGYKITDLGDPVADTDAVNRAYVNNVVANGIGDGDKGDIVVSGSGSTLTIDSGAVTDDAVNPSAGIVASKLSFTQSGTGAEPRTVESKLQDVVNILDFTSSGVTPNADSLTNAFATGKSVLIPTGTTVNIGNESPNIPDGAVIQLNGKITSAADGGRLECLGSITITGTGQLWANKSGVSLKATNGSVFIHGITIGGGLPGSAGILFAPADPGFSSIRIEGCLFDSCNYAILRSGIPSATAPSKNVVITGNVIKNSKGDGIEWNRGDYDENLIITSNVIENTVSTISNAGFGIGVASGGASGLDDPNTPTTSNKIIISNNVINTCFQGVHIETQTSSVIISGNIIKNAEAGNGGAGTADSGGIVVYSGINVNISNNFIADSDGGIDIRAGVYQSNYVGNSVSCTVANNQVINCDQSFLNLGSSIDDSLDLSQRTTAFVTDNFWDNSVVLIQGTCNFKISDNHIYPSLGETGLTLAFADSLGNPPSSLPNRSISWSVVNNTVRDALNQVNVTATDFEGQGSWRNNIILHQHGNNFVINKTTDAAKPVIADYYYSGSGFPTGATFNIGNRVTSLGDNQRYIVTTAGSRSVSIDNYAVVTAATGEIRSINHAWTSSNFHHFGQKITLNDGATTKEGIILRIYVASGQYRIQLVDTAGDFVDLTGLGNGTITSTDEVAYTTLT